VEAKEALSGDTDVLLAIALPGISTTLRLTRSEFEDLIRPALEDTITTLQRTVRTAGRAPDQLSVIVLVGGSSRIPLIGELLHHRFGTRTAMDTHPKHDIALGAVRIDHPEAAAGRAAPPSARIASRSSEGVDRPAPEATTPTARATIHHEAGALSTARRRRLTVIGTGAAALIASMVIGVTLVESRDTNTGQEASQPSVPANPPPSTPTASTQLTSSIGGLPRSAPLAPTQMLVQMQVGNQWDIWVGDTNSSSPVRRLTSGQGFNGWPVISPSFDSVIYIHANDNDNMDSRPEVRRRSHSSLRVAGAAFLEGDRELFALPTNCTRASRVAWDPVDPSRLVVACFDADNSYHLRLMKSDGSLIRVVSPPAGLPRMGDVTFSPDGRLLAFWASADPEWDGGVLYTVPVDGGTPQPLIKDDHSSVKGRDADPVFSPDGRYVAFRRRAIAKAARGQFDIYRVDANGTGLDRLTSDPADDEDPTWSRDSKHIAYKSAAATDIWSGRPIPRIWIMTADGNDKRLLWTNGSVVQQIVPAWTPR
jgi:Tol biopolymer transport system component